MNSSGRTLTAVLTLTIVAVASVVSLGRLDRPAPRLPSPPVSGGRPVPLAPLPPDARRILGREGALGLRAEQRAALEALDARWAQERQDLEAAVRKAQESISDFMAKAQSGRGASVQQIRAESEEFGRA